MEKMRQLEQFRLFFASTFSMLLAVFSDTKHFILALVISFAFNIWAGMRADGISVTRCKNFSFKKFWRALVELYVYVGIIYVIQGIMYSIGDKEEALIVIKTITYIFIYVYCQNGLKNVITAYPKNKALRIIYHVIRFEFTRAMPEKIKAIIERVEREEEDKEKPDKNTE